MKLSYLSIIVFMLCSCAPEDTPSTQKDKVITGAEVFVNQQVDMLEDQRVGIVTNHSALIDGKHLVDVLNDDHGVEITALFAPEHGIRGDAAAGEKIEDGLDQQTGAPVYSLYGETRKPTAEMLENVDVLIFDIQDVGARFYTYISTMGLTMEAAAEHENDITYIVLDRPNPIGGEKAEGFLLDMDHRSFVGEYPIPITHGLTVGELATMIHAEGWMDNMENLNLHVAENSGWSRDMLWPDTGLNFVPPSPNIPDFEVALIYPGACFFEGVTASEGRGTMRPFIQLGAPWIDAEKLAQELNSRNLPGLSFKPISFVPESIEGMVNNPKWEGTEIHGISYVIEDANAVEPVAAGVHVLHAFWMLTPEEERKDFFQPDRITRLAGTTQLHQKIINGEQPEEIIASWQTEVNEFDELRKNYLIY